MKFNVDKYKLMHPGFKMHKVKHGMNATELEQENSESDLGAIGDFSLSMSRHCKEAHKNAKRKLGYTQRVVEYGVYFSTTFTTCHSVYFI